MSKTLPPHYWDRQADPVVGSGPPGSGTVRTKSGRLVDINTGHYTPGPTTQEQNAASDSIRQSAAKDPQLSAGLGPAAPKTRLTPGQYAHTTGQFTTPSGLPDPGNVKDAQKFLVSKGYKIQVDGILGPMTKAAIADFTSGVNNRNPEKFNAAHNLSPTMASTPKAAGMSSAHTGVGASATPTTTPASLGGGPTDFASMIAALLGKAGTNSLIPTSLASDASAPDTALAQTLQDQINNMPNAKAQALADIANWYGQVTDAATKAGQRDQQLANAGAGAVTDNSKGIMASLGGSAMKGSNMIGAEGANDAATLTAMGANDAQLASDLGPIFQLAAAGDKKAASASFDNQLTALQDQFAQAQGKASADKAAALEQILQANNGARQQNFGNESSLLNTLAGLQISGVNAQTKAQSTAMLNALRASEIAKNTKKSSLTGTFAGATPQQKAKVAQAITQALVDTNTGKLKSGLDWPGALRAARNIIRTNGWDPFNPGIVQSVIGPALNMAGVNFQNPQVLYHP